ncbi:DUF4838 domain-containing protein [Agriterribacter sp.]|uniref:DUF4838 domain-containing protein n=1 Tax=Agriterribacter sp. TaxID=2821509 RepID=UPI002BDDB647|nr:DUF4838 domain-containing protein [Agriterribacter sp.]HRP56831.1 DUF4838 domain-containing protein [Agriterribacter sp.]
MIFIRLLLLNSFVMLAVGVQAELPLIIHEKTEYVIVIPAESGRYELLAAKELQKYLLKSSGVKLPIKPDSVAFTAKEIIIGSNNRHLKDIKYDVGIFKGSDGFIIETKRNCLVLAGASDIANFYAVSSFLESFIGCRWYTSSTEVVPRHHSIVLPDIRLRDEPVLKMREIFYRDYFITSAVDSLFARRLKLNGSHNLPQTDRKWGPAWSHSFYFYMPPEKYFNSHPEFYSLVNGKRVHKVNYGSVELDAQLCLMNQNMFEEFVKNLNRKMSSFPNAQNWNLGQMDGHLGACQCKSCTEINGREGSPMGSVLYFVNKVAERFPDKTIATLAYTYTRKPPLTIQPAKNVSIILCNIESPRTNAIKLVEDAPEHASFREDLEGWEKLTDNIIIWDYVIQFERLVSPYPNLSVFQKNFQYYLKHNVTGIFWQGNREVGGEFAGLRAYLLSKLSWNPDYDMDSVMNDFLQGYYGAAAPHIRQYIDASTKALEQSDIRLSMDETPQKHKNGYLSEQNCKQYHRFFENAEAAVAGNVHLLKRVQEAKLPLLFVELELGYGSIERQKKNAAHFFKIAASQGLRKLNEVRMNVSDFRARLLERWNEKKMLNNPDG